MSKNTKIPDKKSFLLYCDQSDLIKKLSDEQAGSLIKQIYSYCGNGRERPEIEDPLIDIVFTALQTSLDRDHSKYLKIVERNRNNGRLGGRPGEPKKPSGLSGNPKNPSEPDNGSDSDNGSDNDKGKELPKEITDFSEHFIDFIHKENPKLKKSNLKKSADTVDKLIRLDKYELAYIRSVLTWAVKDDFWGSQVFSLIPLRAKSKNQLSKFQNIASGFESQNGSGGNYTDTHGIEETQEDIDREIREKMQ